MPIVDVEGFGEIEFPDDMSESDIQSALDAQFSQQAEQQSPVTPPQENPAQPAGDRSLWQQADSALLKIPGMSALAEFATGANQSIAGIIDFIGPDTANAFLELAGSDTRVPRLADAIDPRQNFMEPGMARDVVQTAGKLLPVAAGMTPVVGRNLASAGGIAQEALGIGAAKVTQPVKTAVAAVSDVLPSKAKDAAKLPLYRQSGDIAAAGFKLDETGRVVSDALQKRALKVGVDEGAVAMISAANKPTKRRMLELVDTLEKGRSNLEFRNFNPPQRVVGQAIKDRLSVIQAANKDAAGKLRQAAKDLEGKFVDVSPAINRFIDQLADHGISFNPQNGVLDFEDSSIQGLNEAQGIIKRVVGRLYNSKDPTINARRVHDAKKFIDEQVSYGKSQPGGLSGTMDRIVKELRHNLDGILDAKFPAYERVNSVYSETRNVIDDLQILSGPRVDLTGDRVDKALGVMARKVLSNYNTGTATEDLFDQLDEVAKRYSSPLNDAISDDLRKIVSLEAEVRKMFPTASKPNTFQGSIGAEIGRAATDAATGNKVGLLGRAAKAAGKVFSESDEEKIAALRDLLSK